MPGYNQFGGLGQLPTGGGGSPGFGIPNLFPNSNTNAAEPGNPYGNTGATPGGSGSYTGGADQYGYGGQGEILGGGAVNFGQINLPNYLQNQQMLQGLMAGQSPFASGDWNSVISQLQGRANGTNSLAAQEYGQQQAQGAANLAGMAHGGATPASFRAAAQQQGQMTEGLAAGQAQAQTQEQNTAQQALTSALGTRDQINSSAYQNLMGSYLGLSQQQLSALQGDQSYNLGKSGQTVQQQGNQMNALGALLGAGAKLGS